ncbi:MAG: deoxycytidylate deaminase [Patescibacteria group bacterium]
MAESHEGRWSVDEVYLRICQVLSERTTCLRRKLGAVVVDRGGRIAGTGVNGAPKGLPHCVSLGCLRAAENIESGTRIEVCRGIHAEQNALLEAGLDGCAGGTLYFNGFPCEVCAKLCIQTELSRVVVAGDYPDRHGLALLMQAGIEVAVYPPLPDLRAT